MNNLKVEFKYYTQISDLVKGVLRFKEKLITFSEFKKSPIVLFC